MREITIKVKIGEGLNVESRMEGHVGWSRDEQGKFSVVVMEMLDQILKGKIK